jgi:hypothetical protein
MTRAEPQEAKGKMKRGKKIALRIGGGLVALVLALLLCCRFLGIHSKVDFLTYREMSRGQFHPVWRDLALRRFRRGSDLESLLAKYRPSHREDAGTYARLVYGEASGHPEVTVIAKDGRLTAAVADTSAGRHMFFYDLDAMQNFGKAHKEYTEQKRAEEEAWHIHNAIQSRWDVFLARRVNDSHPAYLAYRDREMRELARQLNEAYKQAEFETKPGFEIETTAEVAEVLSGDLEPGARVTLMIDRQHEEALHEPETVFVREQIVASPDANGRGGPRYRPVSKRAWELYQSLTAEQLAELGALRSQELRAGPTPGH